MFASPNEVAFYICNFPIYFYGIFMALAVTSSFGVISYLASVYHNSIFKDKIYDISLIAIISGILGARLYYCMLNPTLYLAHPMAIFAIRDGGLSIHGALFLGIIVGIFALKKYNLPILTTLDMFAVALPLGQAIGRWGNFFNSEAFGLPTNLPWKLFIPYSKRPLEYATYDYFHPTFLYESILNFILFCCLLFCFKRFYNKHHGLIFALYLMFYSVIRFLIEAIRIDSLISIAGFAFPQIVSIILFLVSILLLLIIHNKK